MIDPAFLFKMTIKFDALLIFFFFSLEKDVTISFSKNYMFLLHYADILLDEPYKKHKDRMIDVGGSLWCARMISECSVFIGIL